MSSGSASERAELAQPPSPQPSAGSARLPTITGCTNSTATWRDVGRVAGVADASSRPPRANRSAMSLAEPGEPLRLGREERGVAPQRRRASRRRRPASGRHLPASGQLQQPVAERVDALAGARADQHPRARPDAPRRGGAGTAPCRSRGAGAGRSCSPAPARRSRNISGYLSGLSSPSVTEETITRASSPTRNSAGQTRLPTFSITAGRSRPAAAPAARSGPCSRRDGTRRRTRCRC